ncbi:MAG: site-specific integrase [Saprospiraceae bacterium]|nr:site-specific integrase [Saprospiraceae bacterium]
MKKLDILKVNFILRSDKKSTGSSPIMMQLYLAGRRAYIGTGHRVSYDEWDSSFGRIKGSSKKVNTINLHLDNMKMDVLQIYHNMKANQEDITVDEIRNRLMGKDEVSKKLTMTISELCEMHNIQYEGLVGVEIGKITFNRYKLYKGRILDFLVYKYQVSDIQIDQIKYSFAMEYEIYLKSVVKLHQNTLVKFMQYLSRVLDYGVKYDYLVKNVLSSYKAHTKETKKEYLTAEELLRIVQKEISIPRLSEVRDCFVFCCYTGYAYLDASLLTPDHIVNGINGKKWIFTSRLKTENVANVPLLDVALEIIEKYQDHPACVKANKLLPMKSNQKLNSYLKEIADICEIKKPLTTHIARHTFATTVLLANGVSMEATSKMLGHSSIKTTQIYGKIVESRVGAEMDILSEKLAFRKDDALRQAK